MRNVGCCTWIFGDCPLQEVAFRVSSAGLDGVELFGDWQNTDAGQVRSVFSDHGLKIYSLTPANADISHPDAAVRNDGIDYFQGLVEYAGELGNPLVSCHGQVGRVAALSSQKEEDDLLVDSTRRICQFAKAGGVGVVFEILNRYETHQIRTIKDGLNLLRLVNAENLGLLPDAYHMNIEEADPAAALRLGGQAVGLYHAADSNRGGIGEGHTDFAGQITALGDIGYRGPIVLEVAAPGPNPFRTDKGDGFRDIISSQLASSVKALGKLGRTEFGDQAGQSGIEPQTHTSTQMGELE